LKKVFAVEVLSCPECSGRMELIAFNADLGSRGAEVTGSRDQLGQVLMNLATNALHAMGRGGRLTIATRAVALDAEAVQGPGGLRPGRYVRLTVSDTGHGMSAATMQRIFEPFFTTKGVGEGTGLGLSVVYGIVHEHSGDVRCTSEVGVGTTFTVDLPVAPGPDRTAALSGTDRTTAAGGRETILVVDDEDAVCAALKASLARFGYAVLDAGDGEAGLNAYRESPRIDLVLTKASWAGMIGHWHGSGAVRASGRCRR
jgi:hypothetical protein